MMKYFFSLLSFVLLYQANSQEITQWRGPNRDGIYSETGLLKKWPANGPKLLWHFDELGPGHSSAAVTKDFIYTAGTSGNNGFVIALNHSGKTVWKTEFGKEWMDSWEGVRSTPLVVGGRVFIMSSYGVVVCMDANDGKTLWKVDLFGQYGGRNIKWGVTENLLLDGNNLICTPGGTSANVIALNKNNGQLVWKSKGVGEKSAYCSPALIERGGKKIIVTQTESHIVGIDATNGNLLWKHHQPNRYSVHANTPLYHDGQIYCVSGYGQGSVMLQLSADGTSVKELWRNKTHDNRMGGFVLYDGRIYGSGDFSRTWVCLDWKTGTELFTEKILKNGNIILSDDMLYCYDEGGYVALVEPRTDKFNVVSKFEVPYGEKQHWAHLVINDKKLYVRHGSSLMVYSLVAD